MPRLALLVVTLAALAAACARTPEPTMPTTTAAASSATTDADGIRAAVAGVVHDLDLRRWDALRARFATDVRTDYTSLFGGEVQTQPADALVGGWRTLLSPLDTTQHVLGPIVVTVDGTRATAHCHVRGYHIAARAPNGGEWMVAGHYDFTLTADPSDPAAGWKVDGITLHTLYQTGNRSLLQEAAAAR
jgi:hypothetical protein